MESANSFHKQGGGEDDFSESLMRRALALAEQAFDKGEVPVGAVVADADGKIIGEGMNCTIANKDGTAHAEIAALRCAFDAVGNYRLPGCAIYATLEPCAMCAGAIFHARLSSLFFGANDDKAGACGSVVDLVADRRLNHHLISRGGILAEESARLLQAFFADRR